MGLPHIPDINRAWIETLTNLGSSHLETGSLMRFFSIFVELDWGAQAAPSVPLMCGFSHEIFFVVLLSLTAEVIAAPSVSLMYIPWMPVH